MPQVRFEPSAASDMRCAIAEAGGIEVLAIGDVGTNGHVQFLQIHARGNAGAVPALMERPRAGQVVIHNHPSGRMEASEADLVLAARYGDEGIGVVIVDNTLEHDLWVVEPAGARDKGIDPAQIEDFFRNRLAGVLDGWEPREPQLEMALGVGRALASEEVLSVEAGTGTGKSLAYLVPAVLWAVENDAKVVVSTYTRALQAQLMTSEIPLLKSAGLEFQVSLLKGRENYLCRRKLEAALEEDPDDAWLGRVGEWARTAQEGSRQDFGEAEERDEWDRVSSHTDQTLRVRCPHYNTCFYYGSRRKAASSHILLVNHALWVADLHVKSMSGGDGLLPHYDRVILDEAHHLEDAVVSVSTGRLTRRRISRAISPLLDRRKKKGALSRLAQGPLKSEPQLVTLCETLSEPLQHARDHVGAALEALGQEFLTQQTALRLNEPVIESDAWSGVLQPALYEMERELGSASDRLGSLLERTREVEFPPAKMQPVLELGRAQRRLKELAELAGTVAEGGDDWCRWLECTKALGSAAAVCRAPVDAGALLRRLAWEPLSTAVLCSATLTVQGRFDHFHERHGIEGAETISVDSPFDYPSQAILGLPTDLPPPDSPDFLSAVSPVVVDLISGANGGAFVLCTSHQAVRAMASAVKEALGDKHPVFVQGSGARERLLTSFRDSHGGILIGTDSFWEGVSVPGAGLRLVVIPKLPFRVPTEPIAEARYEKLEREGKDPFRALSLPQAVLRLRQGFGRLIRTGSDRGAVVVLDRRIHERWYGRVFLSSLPPARKLVGPTPGVLADLRAFYARDMVVQKETT